MSRLLKRVLAFVFDSPLAGIGGVAVILSALIGGFAMQQRNVGAERATQKIERKANENVKRAEAARARAADPGAGGVLDPNARR